MAKKTVLTIATAESQNVDFSDAHTDSDEFTASCSKGRATTNCHSENSDRTWIVSSETALAFACRAMTLSLQFRSWESNSRGDSVTAQELDDLLNQLEEVIAGKIAGPNIAARLANLLELLTSGELEVRSTTEPDSDVQAKKLLVGSVHALIAAHCHYRRFNEAVEQVSQRAIYQFAYGLTHEINNPLANIAARAQQLISSATSDSDRRSLATIVDQSMRAHEMLAEMMRVVQPRSLRPKDEEVVAILEQAIVIQKGQWAHAQVACTLRAPSNPLYVSADKSAILEAICSLLQNAMQICRPNDRIEVLCEEIGPDQVGWTSEGSSMESNSVVGSQIRIAIRDTGPGMENQTVERAWDLYFSGREHGRGLGISLAKVRQTIEAHCGAVWIQSNAEAGCTVEIRLPKLPSPPSPRKAFSI